MEISIDRVLNKNDNNIDSGVEKTTSKNAIDSKREYSTIGRG